jgi:hypothetical protein
MRRSAALGAGLVLALGGPTLAQPPQFGFLHPESAVSANGNPKGFVDPSVSGIHLNQRTGPSRSSAAPGVQSALARFLVSLQAGDPDYRLVTPELTEVLRGRSAEIGADLQAWGPLKSIAFSHVDALGNDVFRASYQSAEVDWKVTPLDKAGLIGGLDFDPRSQPPAVSGVEVTAARKVTGVSGVTVAMANRCLPPRAKPDPTIPAPKVVSTYPGQGQVVPPGVLVLRVTFDLPMTCGALFADDQPLRNPCPGEMIDGRESLDRRTFWTVCVVQKDTQYGVKLNDETARDQGFFGLGGKRAEPYTLTFSTSSEAPVTTLKTAIAADQVTMAYAKGQPSP